jgi:hypothetical protein
LRLGPGEHRKGRPLGHAGLARVLKLAAKNPGLRH